MVRQWQDELEAKFGLSFTLIDREHLATLRREHGYTANPWSSGSRFIISHSLMADETYVGGLRDLLGNFRPRALFILDEAHHAASASGSRYAVDSQFRHADVRFWQSQQSMEPAVVGVGFAPKVDVE
jgi:superfamily II DNA or RNA helicase